MRQSNSHGVRGACRRPNSSAVRKTSAVPTLPALSPNAHGSGERSFDARHTTRRHRELVLKGTLDTGIAKGWTSLPNVNTNIRWKDSREQDCWQDAQTALEQGRVHRTQQEQTTVASQEIDLPSTHDEIHRRCSSLGIGHRLLDAVRSWRVQASFVSPGQR